MLTPEDLKQMTEVMSQMMDEKLKPISERLDQIEDRLEAVEENTKVTRAVVNELVEWVDYNFHDEYPFPVDKKKAM